MRIANSKTIDLAAANTELVERIAQRLYVVNAQIFEGLQEEDFVRYVFRSRFGYFCGESGDIVGYGAVHLYKREMYGNPVSIFRAESGYYLTTVGKKGAKKGRTCFLVNHRDSPTENSLLLSTIEIGNRQADRTG